MKKLLFLVLALLSAALLFSACGNGSDSEGTPATPAAEETLTIRMAIMQGHTEPDSWMQQQIEEKYNVSFEIIPLPGWADGQARINLLMADEQNRPCVIWWWGMEREYGQWVDAGLLVDITDYYFRFPNIREYYSYMNLFMGAHPGTDRMFRIPADIAEPACMTTWVRQDWLDNLNMEIPTTLHEFVNMVERFTHEDPTGTGESVYGFSGQGLEMRSFKPFWGPFNVHPAHFVQLEDGSVIYGATEPGVRDALEYIHNLAIQGAIDPILGVRHANPAEIFINGGHGAFYRWVAWNNPGDGTVISFNNHNPGAVLTAIEPVRHPVTGMRNSEPENPGAWSWVAITNAATDPERIFAMIDDMAYGPNFAFRMWCEEGVHHYFAEDGSFQPLVSTEENMAQNIGLSFMNGFVNRKDEWNITNTPETVRMFQDRAETAVDAAQKRIEWRAVDRPLWFMHGTDIEAQRDEIFYGIMLGQRPVEDWDLFVDMYYNMFDGAAINAEAQALWDEHTADFEAFMETWGR